MAWDCKILADSIASGVRLTTWLVTTPRIILAEVNTHRVFSRSSASSRAIPVEKRIKMIEEDPFIPDAFGENQKGMQARANLDEGANADARRVWLVARDAAVREARYLAQLGVHKQWANRLLEPWAWQPQIITATETDNFFNLRISPEAQPEIRRMAEMMKECMDASTPVERRPGEWHLPLVDRSHRNLPTPHVNVDWNLPIEQQVKLSVARCARVSYLTHEGKRDVDADLALYDRLLKSGHMSPFEHAAKVGSIEPDAYDYAHWKTAPEFIGNFRWPWLQHRKMIPSEAVFKKP